VDVRGRPFLRLKVAMFPKHIGSSEKIDGVALSRSRLGASTRGFEIVAPPFDGSYRQDRNDIYPLRTGELFCREAPQKCASTFIDGRNIENKMYWQGPSGDGLTIRKPKE